MGCFDSFILPDFLECPLCKAKGINSGLNEFQTKEFGEWLECFHLDEEVIWNDCMILKDGKYPVYSSCDSCQAWIDANIVIKKGKFIRIEDVKATTQREKWG